MRKGRVKMINVYDDTEEIPTGLEEAFENGGLNNIFRIGINGVKAGKLEQRIAHELDRVELFEKNGRCWARTAEIREYPADEMPLTALSYGCRVCLAYVWWKKNKTERLLVDTTGLNLKELDVLFGAATELCDTENCFYIPDTGILWGLNARGYRVNGQSVLVIKNNNL